MKYIILFCILSSSMLIEAQEIHIYSKFQNKGELKYVGSMNEVPYLTEVEHDTVHLDLEQNIQVAYALGDKRTFYGKESFERFSYFSKIYKKNRVYIYP